MARLLSRSAGGIVLEYKQIQPPEGINTSKEHPLKEFSFLVVTLVVIVVAAITILSFATHLLAPLIPFSAEQKIAETFQSRIEAESSENQNVEMTNYLQSLADRLAAAQQLPEDMPVTVHYIDDETVNAFATLGGHVFFFRGLLERVSDENTLATVMAHEIAHIKYRHPIKAMGRGVVIGTALVVVGSATGGDVVGGLLGEAGLLTVLKFNREQEEEADEDALRSLVNLYGHTGGSSTLFDVLAEAYKSSVQPPEFFSSHPHTDNRIEAISNLATENNWVQNGELTPLPANFNQWL